MARRKTAPYDHKAHREHVEKLREEAARRGSTRPRANLRALGYVGLPGTARRVQAPDGRNLSYRAAYKEATGLSLEEAVHHPGTFAPELDDAFEIRDAARRRELSKAGLMSADDESALAGTSLKVLVKGHAYSEATRAGIEASGLGHAGLPTRLGARWTLQRAPKPSGGPERETPYGRLLGMLRVESVAKPARPDLRLYPSGPDGRAVYRKAVAKYDEDYERWWDANGPQSDKAKLLVAMGRRDADAEYAVGETP